MNLRDTLDGPAFGLALGFVLYAFEVYPWQATFWLIVIPACAIFAVAREWLLRWAREIRLF